MVRLDKIDDKIIDILGSSKDMNLSQLGRAVWSREGQKVFKERLARLKGLNIITIGTFPLRSGLGYAINLK